MTILKTAKILFLMILLFVQSCYATIGMMPIEALNGYKVLCKYIYGHENIGKIVKDEIITFQGKVYRLPAGTIVDNSDYSGLIFPKDTYLPVGENLIPFKKHEKVFMLCDTAVYIMSGALAKNVSLKVGNMQIPFKKAITDRESYSFREKTQITFHPNGSIEEGCIVDSGYTTVLGNNTIQIPGGSLVMFTDDGSIEQVTLNSCTNLVVGETKIPFRDELFFYPSGKIRSGNICDTVTLNVKDKKIRFCNDGGYYASRDITPGGVLSFYENGYVSDGICADTTSFNMFGRIIKFVPQGLLFDSTGDLRMLKYHNELFRYKTDIPAMSFDTEYIDSDTFCYQKKEVLLEKLKEKATAPFRLKIGGNELVFSRKVYKYLGAHRQIVPDQTVTIGENSIDILALAPTDGTGELFYPNGGIKGVVLKKNCTLKVGNRSILFLKKKQLYESDKIKPDIMFYCDGKVARGFIGQEVDDSIDPIEPEFLLYKSKRVMLKPNQEVYFKKDGTVKYSINKPQYIIQEYATDVYTPEENCHENDNITNTDTVNTFAVDSKNEHTNCQRAVRITSNVSIQMYMDGLPVGTTPVLITHIPQGRHWFTIKGWETISKDLNIYNTDYEKTKVLIESYEESSGIGADTTAYSKGGKLALFGYIRFNGLCNDTLQIHYNIDFKEKQMQYMLFNANVAKEIAGNRNATALTAYGWFSLVDLHDTLMFAKYTEQAGRLLEKEGNHDEAVDVNYAHLLMLRNDTAGSLHLYENVIKNSTKKEELIEIINSDFLVIEKVCPEQEERIFSMRKKLGIFEKDQNPLYW